MLPSKRSLYNCPLAELAELMDSSSWQRNQLARIKGKFGYRLCKSIYGALDKMFCGNLFSYTGATREPRHAKRTRGVQPEEGPEWRDSQVGRPAQCGRWLTLEQANARTFGHQRQCTKIIFLSRLLLVYCCCCCLGLLMSTSFQYKHDYYIYHLKRFQMARLADRPTLYQRLNVTEAHLLERLAEAKAGTKVFGSFLLNRAYFAQSCYILMILLCLFTYPGPLLYFHIGGHFDFHYLRTLLNWDQEQRNCNRMLVDLIEKLSLSSARFMQISLTEHQARAFGFSFKKEKNSTVKLHDGHQQRGGSVRGSALPAALLREQLTATSLKQAHASEHEWLVRRLKLLALTGRLQPLDRCDVREMSKKNGIYSILILLTIGSCFVWNIILFSSLPLYFGFVYELELMDVVSFVELASLNILLTMGGTFYLSLALIYCREQVRSAQKLRSMICWFIFKHRRLLEAADSEQPAHPCAISPNSKCSQTRAFSTIPDNYYDALNTELLLILVHYKIFAQQGRPGQRTFGFVLLCCIWLMTIFPVITRLHLPYLSDLESRLLSIIVCFIMIGLPDLSMVPMCWMHSRCLELSQDLWKLMAVVVHIADHPELGAFLNEHSVWLLRKELSHPEQQYSRFAIVTLGLKFTYAELLKLHFWLGFIILSFILELKSTAAHESALDSGLRLSSLDSIVFGSWLSDPLGISSPLSL